MRREVFGIALLICVSCGPILGIEETRLEEQADCSLVSQRVFFVDKPDDDTSISLAAMTNAEFEQLAESIGVSLDPERGHLIATIHDCDQMPVEDAVLMLDPASVGITQFLIGDTGIELGTDSSDFGQVGVLNLPSLTEFKATSSPPAFDNDVSSGGDIVVRPREVAVITLAPNSDIPIPTQTPSSNFACVGMVEEPMTTASTITISVHVSRNDLPIPSGTPANGVRVRFCVDDGTDCAIDLAQPLDAAREAETVNGLAQLSVPVEAGEGFDGQILMSGIAPGCD